MTSKGQGANVIPASNDDGMGFLNGAEYYFRENIR